MLLWNQTVKFKWFQRFRDVWYLKNVYSCSTSSVPRVCLFEEFWQRHNAIVSKIFTIQTKSFPSHAISYLLKYACKQVIQFAFIFVVSLFITSASAVDIDVLNLFWISCTSCSINIVFWNCVQLIWSSVQLQLLNVPYLDNN